MKFAQIAQSRSASSSVAPRRTELLALTGPRNKNIVFPISPAFPYTCKRLVPQLFSFDIHANSPGAGVPVCGLQVGTVLLLPSLYCRARQLISLFLNSFRTLCQNTRGVPPSAIAPQLASLCLSFATLPPLAVPCMRQLFSCLLIPTSSSLTTKLASANRSRPSLRTRAITSSPPNPPKKRSNAPREAISKSFCSTSGFPVWTALKHSADCNPFLIRRRSS